MRHSGDKDTPKSPRSVPVEDVGRATNDDDEERVVFGFLMETESLRRVMAIPRFLSDYFFKR